MVLGPGWQGTISMHGFGAHIRTYPYKSGPLRSEIVPAPLPWRRGVRPLFAGCLECDARHGQSTR